MQKKLIFLLLILKFGCSDSVYDSGTLYNCRADADYTTEQRMEILKLYPTDAYMFIIFGPISFLASLFIITTFVLFPTARQIPGDILLGLSVCNALESIHYIMSGWYFIIYDNSPYPEGGFCQTSGAISVFASTGSYAYNLAFVTSPLIIISNTLVSKKYFQLLFYIIIQIFCRTILHGSIIFFIFAMFTFSLVSGKININLSGQCTLAQVVHEGHLSLTFFYSFPLAGYVVISQIALTKFKKTVPKNENLSSMRKIFLAYYKKFVFMTALLWGVQFIFAWIIEYNCNIFQVPWLNISITLYNVASVLIPILQTYFRSQDPVLRSKIRKLLKRLLPKKVNIQDSSLSLDKSIQLSDIDPSRRDSNVNTATNLLEEIQQQMKRTQVYTLLAGVQLMIEQQRRKDLKCTACDLVDEEEKMNKEMHRDRQFSRDQIQATINEIQKVNKKMSGSETFNLEQANEKAEIIFDNNSNIGIPLQETSISLFRSKVTYYGPKIFEYIQIQDEQMINILESINVLKNKDKVQYFSAGPDGGKSGEFFFFSWDNKLILKTMKWEEVMALRKRLQMYGNYLSTNPDSLISKIYGIFSIKRLDIGQRDSQQIHILLMRNISLGYQHYFYLNQSVPRQYITRTFDMKGSEFDREVLKKKMDVELNRVTLKDTDFLKLEEKVWIKPILAEICSNSLKCDANFFKQAGFIDYSLLVFKVDWGQYFIDHQTTYQKIRAKLNNGLYMIESTSEKGIFYHIAIIDYLQEWNVEKQSEQITKRLIKMNASLDTSSQNPYIYAERFKTKLVDKIFSLDKDSTQTNQILERSNAQVDNIGAININNEQL